MIARRLRALHLWREPCRPTAAVFHHYNPRHMRRYYPDYSDFESASCRMFREIIPVYRQPQLGDCPQRRSTLFQVLGRGRSRVFAGKRGRRRAGCPLQLYRDVSIHGLSGGFGPGPPCIWRAGLWAGTRTSRPKTLWPTFRTPVPSTSLPGATESYRPLPGGPGLATQVTTQFDTTRVRKLPSPPKTIANSPI